MSYGPDDTTDAEVEQDQAAECFEENERLRVRVAKLERLLRLLAKKSGHPENCNGAGWIECHECDGESVVREDVDGLDEIIDCENCEGCGGWFCDMCLPPKERSAERSALVLMCDTIDAVQRRFDDEYVARLGDLYDARDSARKVLGNK